MVHLVTLPVGEGVVTSTQSLVPPVSTFGARTTGAVITMEWSSDGYVLAVGWEQGWAIWSVGGRCLASAFDLEEQSLDEKKLQDAFMYGVKHLVSLLLLCSPPIVTHPYSSGLLATSSSWSLPQIICNVSQWLGYRTSWTCVLIVYSEPDAQLYVIPFAKSAATSQHAPVG